MSENMSDSASRRAIPTPRDPEGAPNPERAGAPGERMTPGASPYTGASMPEPARGPADVPPFPQPPTSTPLGASAPQPPAPTPLPRVATPSIRPQGAHDAPNAQGVPNVQGVRSSQSFPSAAFGAPIQPANASTTTAPAQVRTKHGPGWGAMFLAMALTAGASIAGSWALFTSTPAPVRVQQPTTAQSASTVQPVAATGTSPDWQAVAEAVSPAVVTISVQADQASGVGSGVVYDAEGDIVTNYHVIASAIGADGAIRATLADGRILEAEVVGHDRSTDLAVIRLKNAPSDLTVGAFGTSKDLAVGQQVMAVGAPLGLSNTATTGIISALNRPVEVSPDDKGGQGQQDQDQQNPLDPFNQLPGRPSQQAPASSEAVITNAIQVDASINPGNSGGPLFDATGRVIGINSSIASNTSSQEKAGSIGLGFAIPADLVTSVVDQLISTGTAEHAVLGVSVRTGGANVEGTTVAGAEVAEVPRGGAAEAAGIQNGDVITAVNGETVSSSKQLTGYIRRYRGGDQVTITYVRGGAKYEVIATLQAKTA